MSDEDYDLIENPTPRCACMLVLDVSGSMEGNPIRELNAGVKQFIREICQNDFASNAVELGVITFGGAVKELIPIQSAAQVNPPQFPAVGNTPMGEAVLKAIEILEWRKQEYKNAGVSYYQPWLVLMTDGEPTDDYAAAAATLRQLGEQKKMLVFGIGVGTSCNMVKLAQFCPSNRQPKRLAGLNFPQFFEWLSQSMERVSVSIPGTDVTLPPTSGWESIQV